MDEQSTPDIRHDWTQAEAQALFDLPLTELVFRAQAMHRRHQPHDAVQLSTLLSIKTGSCPEDCSYCSQSARHKTKLESEALMSVEAVLEKARQAQALGASRFCMGAAWRSPKKDSRQFEQVLEMIRGVRDLGMEACVTAGMLDREQAQQLKEAGLTAYNHNIDTSREYYDKVITTRTFDDRLETIKHVSDAGIHVCSGGILGLGEGEVDRVSMLVTLATLRPHPESVPINALVAIKGTPLEGQPPVDPGLRVVESPACRECQPLRKPAHCRLIRETHRRAQAGGSAPRAPRQPAFAGRRRSAEPRPVRRSGRPRRGGRSHSGRARPRATQRHRDQSRAR